MRTFFEPDEPDAFAAAQDLLCRRLAVWAQAQGHDADPLVAGLALDYRHRGTRDGRLALWTPQYVRGFLLDWLPRTLTLLPGDGPPDAPGTLRLLLRYLDAAGLTDPRGASTEENERAIDAAAADYPAAMADRQRWGLAKFWATTAAAGGVDITDPGALQRFTERTQRGDVRVDEELLEKIALRHRTQGPAAAGRALPQLPVSLPPEDILREQAGASPVVRRLRGLAEWPGASGRPLTGTGQLRLADARELAGKLATGDHVDQVRTAAGLPVLGLAFEWAKQARLVRTAKGRLYAVARARPVLQDALALWLRAFEALPGLRGPLLGARAWQPESMLFELYHEVLPDVLNTLYSLPEPMPWPQLRDSVHLAYRAAFPLPGDDDPRVRMWLGHADADLRRVLDVLEDLGAIERSAGRAADCYLDAPPDEQAAVPLPEGMPPELAGLVAGQSLLPRGGGEAEAAARAERLREELTGGDVELIRLTALGTYAVRLRLLGEGRDAPLLGELREAPAAGLLGVLAQHYDPGSARAEGEAWIAAHGGLARALGLLTDAVKAQPYRTRAAAMLDTLAAVLGEAEGTGLLRALRGDPALAPTALSVLDRRGLLRPDDCTDAEGMLMIAESMLQMLESAGPQETLDALLASGRQEARQAVSAALASGHPDATGLAELRTLAGDQLQGRATRLGRPHTAGAARRGRRPGRKRQ
ncbi:MAG TPA: hypothetical protein VKV80_00250 [Streptosporangiaceae bacterium]|nr:hypothetical protein [Streptosporangiaceae bacterium]